MTGCLCAFPLQSLALLHIKLMKSLTQKYGKNVVTAWRTSKKSCIIDNSGQSEFQQHTYQIIWWHYNNNDKTLCMAFRLQFHLIVKWIFFFCRAAWIDKCRPDVLITESTYATTIRDSKRFVVLYCVNLLVVHLKINLLHLSLRVSNYVQLGKVLHSVFKFSFKVVFNNSGLEMNQREIVKIINK